MASSWPDDITATLIELWSQRPLLYNVQDKDYLNKNKRHKAREEVVTAIGKDGNCIVKPKVTRSKF